MTHIQGSLIMEKTNFELEAEDCVIVFKKDMTTELILPEIADDESIDFKVNQNVFVAMAISASMNDAGFRKIVGEKLDEMFKMVESSNEKVPSCDPSDCDKGCCEG